MAEIRRFLKYRLKSRKNKEYIKWLKDVKPYGDLQHILGSVHGKKLNDLLLAPIDHTRHMEYDSKGYSEEDFNEDFINSMENLFDYIEYLQEEVRRLK